MDIIVTTPKFATKTAAKEAEKMIAAGGGFYFRRFDRSAKVDVGDRVYYVEDGFIRGFAEVSSAVYLKEHKICSTTGITYPPGFYVFMDATTWKWMKPIPKKGFQGYRYAFDLNADIVGGWLDPKPA